MSADTENVQNKFVDQLADFDDRLHSKSNDVEMLAGIQDGIERLLASSGGSESQIRRVLQDRYESGDLRKETFQLVKSMLDRYVTEKVPTSPVPTQSDVAPKRNEVPALAVVASNTDSTSDEPRGDDAFGSTTIIPADVFAGTTADLQVQVGSVLRDRFLLQKQVSGGSMGVVYKALDRRLAEAGSKDHWVAIKVLSPQLAENPQALRALQQEAAKGRCLVHPNIVRFIDLDRDDDLYFLIMEWLEGRTLADLLDSKDASVIDHAAAFRIVRQIGDALDYAHRCGIVHADVKPGNIMIMPNGNAKLFDFGVARVRQQHADSDFDPGILGAMTPAYSSMQVLTGEEPVASDDVFSLGCLLYRLIAGYRVFGPRNAAEAAQEGMTPQRLKSLSDEQWSALKKSLSYARVTRFASVREFIDALGDYHEEPFRVEAPDRFVDPDESSGGKKWLIVILVLMGLAAAGAHQTGYLDQILERFDQPEPMTTNSPEEEVVRPVPAEQEPVPAAQSKTVVEPPDAVILSAPSNSAVSEPPAVPVGPDPMLVDFSRLPAPTIEVRFSPGRNSVTSTELVVREDADDAVIDFIRDDELSVPMTLRLEEVGFSGNRSPWAAGQYALSNAGLIQFPAGQARGRIRLTVASDPMREADQQSTLRLRQNEFADSELALLVVTLEDDDQRLFESNLPLNTVAFAASQASIRESDPAVQIDLVRFNPDDTELSVGFSVEDITATEGEDYFAPGGNTITFGPGQRAARILIPLVRDAAVEGDEAFSVQLEDVSSSNTRDVFRRIVVMIRDDEPQTR